LALVSAHQYDKLDKNDQWVVRFAGTNSFGHQQSILFTNMELKVNKDQVKGAAKDLAGKIQEEAGKLIGNKEQQIKGLKHQAEGNVQQHVGTLKEAIKDIKKI
jgi:uncharacterized protein YjbJ (UPF0337 family)